MPHRISPIVAWVFLVALVVWLGGMTFFSFIVAPTLFRTLPVETAGSAVSAIFPWYYRVGYVCGAVLVAGSAWCARRVEARTVWTGIGLTAALMLAGTLYAGLVVQPRAAALRPALHTPDVTPAVRAEFDHLHRRAVQVNGAVWLGGLVITGLTVRALRA